MTRTQIAVLVLAASLLSAMYVLTPAGALVAANTPKTNLDLTKVIEAARRDTASFVCGERTRPDQVSEVAVVSPRVCTNCMKLGWVLRRRESSLNLRDRALRVVTARRSATEVCEYMKTEKVQAGVWVSDEEALDSLRSIYYGRLQNNKWRVTNTDNVFLLDSLPVWY